MKYQLSEYKSLVFDCDGVILNSNKVKTDAFYNAAREYGELEALSLVKFHIEFGGVSRFKKFKHFFKNILHREYSQFEYDKIISKYAQEVRNGLLTCEIAEGLADLRELTKNAVWFVASGGAQDELREVFHLRGLDKYFDGGVYGSPTPKDEIVKQQLEDGVVNTPALFLGDSRFDHEVATEYSLDFVFLTEWTEFAGLKDYAHEHSITCEKSIQTLVSR
jgi:phosphoglycolate phosphatase-like HAD superfamily hydrolase